MSYNIRDFVDSDYNEAKKQTNLINAENFGCKVIVGCDDWWLNNYATIEQLKLAASAFNDLANEMEKAKKEKNDA